MSGGTSSYPGKTRFLELKIIVRYEGLKATQYFSKYTSKSEVVFKEDLLALKLPHPKRENTTFVSYGCIECVWPSVAKDGNLHRQTITRTKPHSPTERKALENLLEKLSISSLVAKEIFHDVGKGRKNLKRPNPFVGNEVEKEGSSVAIPRPGGSGPRPSTRLPPVTGVPRKSASSEVAEAFLQDVRDSFRPHKIPKIEPVDVPLPPDSPPKRLVRTPHPTSLFSSRPSSTSKATHPPESVSGSVPVSQTPPQARNLVCNVSPFRANHVSFLPSKPPPTTTSTSDLGEIIRTSLPDQPLPIKEMLRELQPLFSVPQSLAEPAKHEFRVPDVKTMNTTPIPTPEKLFKVTTDTNSRPKMSDIPTIQRLTRASCDLRRQITADIVRDTDIILELKQLNAAYIPRPLRIRDADTALERRIMKLEQDLDSERRMRLEAEDVINDIRRECKAPFIVPGLLDAFIKLSRLTTQATHSNGTVAEDNG